MISEQICKTVLILLRNKLARRTPASRVWFPRLNRSNSKLTHLRAQLRLANKLIEFMLWQDNLRAELATRITVAETVEKMIKESDGSAVS